MDIDPITGLAIGRVGIGAVSILSPSLASRLFLMEPAKDGTTRTLSRLFGTREVALGALTLAAKKSERRRLVTVGIAVDGSDAVTGLLSAIKGEGSRKGGVLLAAVGAGAVVAGLQGLDDL